jgi:PTS system galactitol-specific IIA component
MLKAHLDPSLIVLEAEARSAEEAITLLAGRLEAAGRVRPSYGPAVIERERTMPTGLPLGAINAAIPHTDREHVIAPAVALAVLRAPVAFASMDDPETALPVRVVFALAITDKNGQIALLQAIMTFLQDQGALERLLAARTPDEALALLAD